MIRKLLFMSTLGMCTMICSAQTADMASQRLNLLALDANAPEISKFIDNILKSDDNPVNYLPIINTLDSLSQKLEPYVFFKNLPLKKFVDDLHSYSEAIEVLESPYDGTRINAVSDRITQITFITQAQLENAHIDSIADLLRQYYGITTNFKELLNDLIDGQKRYVAETKPEKKDTILSDLEESISFNIRNERISRIPYLRSQLKLVVKACPRRDDKKLLPASFDMVLLQNLYDANEKARATRVKETSKDKPQRKK